MDLWIIEPHDPLIVRDGRPFGPTPGARARSLDFPYPSTIAGGLRTRAGQENGRFNTENIPKVLQMGIYGPLLAELDDDDKPSYLAPAPADALLLRENEETAVIRHRLRPLKAENALSDLPKDLEWMVGLARPDLKKPYKDAPHYWHWKEFAKWLTNPPDPAEEVDAAVLGHDGPGKEWRVHAAINPDTFTGIEGALFATSGLEFWQRPYGDEPRLSDVKRLCLTAAVENLNGLSIDEGFAPLGGERRIMRWKQSKHHLPEIPEGMAESIVQTGHCRLILLTPAHFNAGWRPEWLLDSRFGVDVMLKAAVVGKPQTVSGWDFAKRNGKGEPKPTRRLVPSGSVYFLELTGNEAARRAWVEEMWLSVVSDGEDDRRAGFGLTAVGVWDGQAVKIEED